jgi:hypothetical protein
MEMTPRPEIEVTDEKQVPFIVEARRAFLRHCASTSRAFDAVIELWREVHLVRIGRPNDYVTDEDYLEAVVDPDPYDDTYIFYCLK